MVKRVKEFGFWGSWGEGEIGASAEVFEVELGGGEREEAGGFGGAMGV